MHHTTAAKASAATASAATASAASAATASAASAATTSAASAGTASTASAGTASPASAAMTSAASAGTTAVPPAVTGEQIRIVLMNAQSVRNKTMLINEYVRDDDIDSLAITETWLKRGGDSAIITELAPDGYSFVHVPRQRGRGGGVGLLHRETYSCKLLASPCFKHMELLRARLTGTNVRPFDVYVVYHPPVSTKNSGTLTDFITELETLFNAITLSVVPAIVVGDFNIHYDDPSKADKLIDLLDTFGLIQHVKTPTHIHGHILDLVISRAVDQSVASVTVKPMSIADHHCIDCVLAMHRPTVHAPC